MGMILLRKAEVLFRDERGWNIDPFWRDEFENKTPENIHVVNVPPQTVRANHYHQRRIEYICIIGGRVQIRVLDQLTLEQEDTITSAEEPVILKVRPNLVHAIKNIGDLTVVLICYSDLPYDPQDSDIVRYKILD